MIITIFFIGCGVTVVQAMQAWLMDISKKAQTLSAALNHSAYNIANANCAWFGGLAIAVGYGWAARDPVFILVRATAT